MSNIDKQAVQAVADLKAGYTLGNADVEIIQQMALDAVTLLNEIAELEQRHCGTALLEREEMHTKTLGRMLDELDAKDRRIAEQRGIILSARNFISEYAERGDVGAEEFVSIIDRAAGTAKGE